MTDIQPKLPTQASFLPMAITGIGSSLGGDKLGDALAEILAWTVAYKCQCVPPEKVISAFHTLCVMLVVGLAFLIHYLVIKRMNKGE